MLHRQRGGDICGCASIHITYRQARDRQTRVFVDRKRTNRNGVQRGVIDGRDVDRGCRRVAVRTAVVHDDRNVAIDRARILTRIAEYDLMYGGLIGSEAGRTRQRDCDLSRGGRDRRGDTGRKLSIDRKTVSSLRIRQLDRR